MRVLITSVRAGSGHVRAAEAILSAFQKFSPSIHAVHVDAIDMVTPRFRQLYVKGYNATVNRVPALWGRLYRFWDYRPSDTGLTPLLHRTQRRFAAPFFQFLRDFQPDLILSTHFLIPQLLATHGQSPSFCPPVECVITDYNVHQFWVSDAVSRYYVAHAGMVNILRQRGVPPSQVIVSGIPIHPCFTKVVSTSSVFQSLDLDPHQPVILMLAGGIGLSKLEGAVKHLLSLPGKLQIVTVAGRNAALKTRLNELQVPPSIKLLNLGYVDNMHELLSISSLVITKPGGLTVSECLAKKKVMLLISPIPGQEEKNADYVAAQGAAFRVDSLSDLPLYVTKLLTNRSLRERMEKNAQACARPHAALTIVQTIAADASVAA